MAKLDRLDNRILQELSKDGRISNVELADRIGLSPSACLRRTQELKRSGVIQGYRVVLNRAALGIGFTAYVEVGLSDHSKASRDVFERLMRDAPEVRECHNVTGTFEYLLRVEVTDTAAYKTFHADVLGVLPHVNSITTHMVIDTPKDVR